jgi:hypothetical protein
MPNMKVAAFLIDIDASPKQKTPSRREGVWQNFMQKHCCCFQTTIELSRHQPFACQPTTSITCPLPGSAGRGAGSVVAAVVSSGGFLSITLRPLTTSCIGIGGGSTWRTASAALSDLTSISKPPIASMQNTYNNLKLELFIYKLLYSSQVVKELLWKKWGKVSGAGRYAGNILRAEICTG